MRHAPQTAKPTQVTEWDDGRHRSVLDEVAVEEPLEIRVNHHSLGVTMRTPGDDFELVAGFLLSEGVITARAEIVRIAYGRGPGVEVTGNRVEIEVTSAAAANLSRLDRATPAMASCGICGRASIDAIRNRGVSPITSELVVTPAFLTQLPDALRFSQKVFGRTGGLHAAALFDERGEVLAVSEDIGRHNAVDKAIGKALLSGSFSLDRTVLLVSGRGGFEIVQKAVMARIPVVASVSAPSSLAVQLARDFGLTLIGFLRGQRFIVYSGEQRIDRAA